MLGWGYLILAGGDAKLRGARDLPTNKLLHHVYKHAPKRLEADPNVMVLNTAVSRAQPYVTSYPASVNFMQVGHLLLLLLFAVAGGAFAAFVYATRDKGDG